MVDESNRVINALKETGFFKPKKMFDGGKVILGIIVLLVLVAFPFLYNKGKAAKVPDPKTDTPEIQRLPEKDRVCVEPKEYMRENHMKLLNEWRDWVVRKASRDYIGFTKKKYTMSLQNTCLGCHSNYDNFCNECHKYAGIEPYCWRCHVNKPKEWAAGELREES